MSRIHEALKRAEQERVASAAGKGDPGHAGEVAPVQPGAPAMAVTAVTAADPVPVPGNIPSFGSPFTFDTLLARCGQSQWNPDAKTMLFFNDDEQATGTEEFRTLRSRLYQMREKMSLKK